MKTRWPIFLALLLTALLYWPGLNGPFLFDDFFNLTPVHEWASGSRTWQSVVLQNVSGSLGRPVSMASFVLTAELFGPGSFGFKFGNLLVHMACGSLAWTLVRRMMQASGVDTSRATTIATIVAAVWLLHPIHVSTVLYAVQRMAQLSTLFVLLSLLAYAEARVRLERQQLASARLMLFTLFPLLLVAGLLSKENAAVAPALCAVLELSCFQRHRARRPTVAAFFVIFLAVPAALAMVALALKPDVFLAGYTLRDFTLAERLLSQPRALMEYAGQLLIPRGPQMGLYTDDFITSTSLLSPPSTLWAILAMLGISSLAVVLRKTVPGLFAGWFFFLAAHGVESTFLPLEMYFEHRNYLPAVGFFLAIAAACAAIGSRLPLNAIQPKQLGRLVAGTFIFALSLSTGARVLVWQDKSSIAEQGLKHHPNSLRASTDAATVATLAGDHDRSLELMRNLANSPAMRSRIVGRINSITAMCVAERGGDSADLAAVAAEKVTKVTLGEVHVFRMLARTLAEHSRCGTVDDTAVADAIVAMLAHTTAQPAQDEPKWLMRYTAAELYLRAGAPSRALEQGELAWQSTADPPIGLMLARIHMANGSSADALRVLDEVSRRAPAYDAAIHAEIVVMRQLIESLPSASNAENEPPARAR